MSQILKRKPVDRIGLYEHFWGDTQAAWTGQGHIKEGEDLATHFGFDMEEFWTFNCVADLDFKPIRISEDADTYTDKDGNGAILRHHKHHDTTPEHVDFTVRDRESWEKLAKPLLKPDPHRIDFDGYRTAKARAAAHGRFFAWSGVNVFELMHPLCGHEYMLEGMIEDPDWIRDMVEVYSSLTVALQEMLFSREGRPDGIWYYEDMGFKDLPFMSPAMYKELIQPGHLKTIGYNHSIGLPVIMHSCGMVEKLLPGMVESGIDCLQVIEIKAGMDLLRIHREYGDRLSLMGGIDVRTLYTNNPEVVEIELTSKIPPAMKGFGYTLHSDHSIPNTVEYATYHHFIERGLEMGTY